MRTIGITFAALAVAALLAAPAVASTVDFEDVGASLEAESYWNGSPDDGDHTFESGGFTFHNNYNATYGSWAGWSYSNSTDTTNYGVNQWQHQWSAMPGGGAGGSSTYAVGFTLAFPNMAMIDVPAEVSLISADFTNTTYAYYTMLEGNAFAKKFGGADGTDPDWFLLTISGQNGEGDELGTVDFYLADFRHPDSQFDYIIDEWVTVDLSPIASAERLVFDLTSSDTGDWGMNTPAFFAMDNLVFDSAVAPVPEPSTVLLFAGGALGLGWLGWRRRSKTQPRNGT